jgi:mono/diheme cytochrome c family protein
MGTDQELNPKRRLKPQIRVWGKCWPLKIGGFLICLTFLSACANDMSEQPRYEPLEPSEFFSNASSNQPLVEGAVHWGESVEDVYLTTGRSDEGDLLDAFPSEVTLEVLQRGRERYDIFCSPCHGLDGYGQGMIVQRGFSPPPSLHAERLREAPAGHFYDVISNGFGQMYAYDYRLAPADRWAVVAYIRALQLSQNASQEDVPADELQSLPEAGE